MKQGTGCIYKIENIINKKIYIGQTISVMDRWRQHYLIGKRGKSKYDMYNDMHTMGMSAFTFQILEDEIPVEKLDEKEQAYIEMFSSDKHGYNIMPGGKHRSVKEKLTKDVVLDIRTDIKNRIPFKQIAETYGVNVSTVSDINNGDTWHDDDISYPIAESNYKKKHFSSDEIDDIYDRLRNHQTATSIARMYTTSVTTISKINHGKIYARENTQYPICEPKTSPRNLDKNTVVEIAHALKTTTENYVSLSKKYHVGRKTITGINNGVLYKKHLEMNGYDKFPIRI